VPAPPGVDRLTADVEIRGDLRHRPAGSHEGSSTLRRNSPVPGAGHSLTDRTAYLPAEAADRSEPHGPDGTDHERGRYRHWRTWGRPCGVRQVPAVDRCSQSKCPRPQRHPATSASRW
jgi:hypothetical protein